MKIKHLLSILGLVISTMTFARAAPATWHELTVRNFNDASLACIVRMPLTKARCTPEGCILRAPVGSKLGAIELSFSCGPTSAPTGFENPAPEVKVETLRTKNAQGHFSLIDEVSMPGEDRFRYANFCLYGKFKNFCGTAKVMRLGDRPKADGTKIVKAFLQELELQEPWTKDVR